MHIKYQRLWMLLFLISVVICPSEFQEWKQKYNVTYKTKEEEKYREKVFNQNAQLIRQANKKSSVVLSPNQFGDWTQKEFKERMKTETPLAINKTTVMSSRINKNPVVFPRVRAIIPPETFSWSDLGKVTPAKNQDVCGSCWSFSSIALIQAYAIIKENRVMNLSQQYGLECNSQGMSCGGGDPTLLMMEILEKGVTYSIDYPYDYINGHFGICQAKNRYFLPENTAIVMSFDSSQQQLKQMIQLGPILTLFKIPQGFDFTYYSSGVYTGCKPNVRFEDVDHALIMTGYDTTSYEIKNSWGESWGQRGFADISKINNCGIGLFNIQLQTCPQGQYYSPPTFPNAYGYLTYIKNINCVACPNTCRTCTSPTVCTGCLSGQFLLYGTCVSQCSQFLIKQNGVCKCPQGSFYLNGQCRQCSVNCKSCDNSTYCTACLDNYFLNYLQRICQSSCPAGTQTMPGGICTCLNGTYYDKGCKSCIANCQYCTNPYSCSTCNFGFYLNTDKTLCSNCPNGCKYCTKSTECLQCQDSFYKSIIDNLCYAACPLQGMVISNNTCSCQNGYDPATSKCIAACPLMCNNCVDAICYSCNQGLFLSGQSCLNCSANCVFCQSLITCLTCANGYYVSSGSCVKCQASCKECTNGGCNSCISPFILTDGFCGCPDGQYSYQDMTCLSTCPVNMTINTTSGKCVCTLFQVNGTCRDCPNLCKNCSGVLCSECVANSTLKNGSCLCNSGFFSAAMECRACSTGCKVCSNTTFCSQCATNYKQYKGNCCLNGSFWNGTACEKCRTNCTDCQNDTCTRCPTTFNLVGGDCVCNSTSALINNTCKACVAPCSTCLNLTYCSTCLNPFVVDKGSCNCPTGFYVSGEICLNCTTGCTFCTGLNQCQECTTGYYLNYGNCQACSSNCMRCNQTACTVCRVPYVLVSGKCAINNNSNSVPQPYGCDLNCETCYSFAVCYSCLSGFLMTQTHKCVPTSMRIWYGYPIPYVPRPIPIVVLNSTTCSLTTPRNISISLPYTTVNDANTIILSYNSVMIINNAIFNISGSSVTYGQPSMYFDTFGVSPNRYTVINYRLVDCMSNLTNWWTATVYENKTTGFDIMMNEVPAGADRSIQIKTGNVSVAQISTASRMGYSLNVGNMCMGTVANCSLCQATLTTCRQCDNGFYLLNGGCVRQCPTNYVLLNGICQPQSQPAPAPAPTTTTSDNKNNAILWIVVGIGSLVLLSAIVGIIYCCIRKSMLERENAMNRDIANAAIAASALRPVMQSPPIIQPVPQTIIQPMQFNNRLSGVIAGAPPLTYQVSPYSYRLV